MAERLEPVRQVKRGVNGGEAVLDDGRTVELADFPERVAARLLDPFVLLVLALGTFAIVVWEGTLRGLSTFGGPPSDVELAELHEDVQSFGLKVSLVVFGVIALYEISATTLPEQARGKARRRVRVVSVDGEAVLSLGRVWLRGLVPAAAGAGGSFAVVLVDLRHPAFGGFGVLVVGVSVGDVGQSRPRYTRHRCGHRRDRRPGTRPDRAGCGLMGRGLSRCGCCEGRGDTMWGNTQASALCGGDGDDTLDGHAGDDSVHGGRGDDMVRGGNGDDVLWGGSGNDRVLGGSGADVLFGGSGADSLRGDSQDDVLWGGAGKDILDGGGHDDELHGGTEADTIWGGAGADRVYGGSGDDTLDGGNGVDHLDGGTGTDTCARTQTTTRCERQGRTS